LNVAFWRLDCIFIPSEKDLPLGLSSSYKVSILLYYMYVADQAKCLFPTSTLFFSTFVN
jgi:hypothetical protein